MGTNKMSLIGEIAKNYDVFIENGTTYWCNDQTCFVPEHENYLNDDELAKCIKDAPLFDESKNVAALNECAKEAGYDVDDKNSCALKCTLEAIGVYWVAAARCIEKEAANSCITVECPAITAAFDIPCLRSCHNAEILN